MADDHFDPYRMLPADNFFSDAAFGFTQRFARITPPREMSDILKPGFWSHVEQWFRPNDLVWVMQDGTGSIALLRCISPVPNLQFEPVRFEVPEALLPPPQFEIRWNVGKRGYDIFHFGTLRGDGMDIKSRADADRWIEVYKAKLAAAIEEPPAKPAEPKAKKDEPQPAA